MTSVSRYGLERRGLNERDVRVEGEDTRGGGRVIRVFGGVKGQIWKGGETRNAVWLSEGGTGNR